ncbi:MAG: hypothetical protein ACLP0J_09525 [Solirubrobacteraceae bacterium]
MSKHLDRAEEQFRQARANATSDPSTIQALTTAGRALARAVRELEALARQVQELQSEVRALRTSTPSRPTSATDMGPAAAAPARKAVLVVRDPNRQQNLGAPPTTASRS